MRNLLFVLASTASFAIINPAIAQYVAPAPGVGVGPGYTPPPPPATPGYMWREQRLNEDPRRSDSAAPQQLSPNNTTGGGSSVGVTDPNAIGGECAKGMSEETCRRRGQMYNPPR